MPASFTWGFGVDDIKSCVFVGVNSIFETNPNGTNIADGVNIGSNQWCKELGGVCIGGWAENGTSGAYPSASNYGTVVGYGAKAWSGWGATAGDTVVGANSKTGVTRNSAVPANASTILGFQCVSSGAGKNILIGGKTSTAFANSILIINNLNGASYNGTQDNQIKIGDATHTKVEIGPFDLSNPTAGYFSQTASVTVANTIAEKTIVGAGRGSMVIPAARLMVGTTIRIRARGIIADTLTPTLRLRIKIGATTFCDTGAIALTALTGTHGWVIDADITVRTAGAGGTALGQAIMNVNSGPFIDMDTTNTVAGALDTTNPQTADVTVEWGTANAANTLTATNLTLELIG